MKLFPWSPSSLPGTIHMQGNIPLESKIPFFGVFLTHIHYKYPFHSLSGCNPSQEQILRAPPETQREPCS